MSKAINVNGEIKKFSSVPKSWGNKMGLQYATDSDLEDIGFYDIHEPSKNESQEYGDLQWSEDNSRFEYPVQNKTFSQTLAELKEQKIAQLEYIYNEELSKTDWQVTKLLELGESIPSDLANERAALRTECNTKEDEINALTTKAAVVDYILPRFI